MARLSCFTPGKDPVPIVLEAGWAPGPVWTGAENSPPPGFGPQTVQPVARCVQIQYKPTKCTLSTYKTAYTDACKMYHTITVHTTIFLKMNPWVQNT